MLTQARAKVVRDYLVHAAGRSASRRTCSAASNPSLAAYAFSFSAKALRNFSSLGAMMNRQYGWLAFSLK